MMEKRIRSLVHSTKLRVIDALNIELLKDQQMRCHHRVSQGRAPLSRLKVRNIFGHYPKAIWRG
jgi:hypothetical protein